MSRSHSFPHHTLTALAFPTLLLSALLLTTACTSDEDQADNIVMKTAQEVTLLPTAGEQTTFEFEAPAAWTATTTASWLTLNPTKGGKGDVSLQVTATNTNRTGAVRQAQININIGALHKSLYVKQGGEYAIFDQKTYTIGAEGGQVKMTFRSNTASPSDLLVTYLRDEWFSFEQKETTRAEWKGQMATINVLPNSGREQRAATFTLALPKGDNGAWVDLDTAIVVQRGLSSGYKSTDYSQDGKVEMLQEHTTGHGIPVVLMGDAFTDLDISDSTYYRVMEHSMECLFSEEPVRSLRSYFDIYMVYAVSEDDAVGEDKNTAFSSVPDFHSTNIDADANRISDYANKVERADSMNMLVVVVLNANVTNGVTYLYNYRGQPSQYAVALCPLQEGLESEAYRQVLVHEAIGHGLAKLADEYGYDNNGQADEEVKKALATRHEYRWMMNVDTTDDLSKVVWWPFVGDKRFADEQIGAYEGGYTYTAGVWKPTQRSMMNRNDSPFNAPSRKAVYDRIRYLGENALPSTMGEFAEFDALHKPEQWDYSTRSAGNHNKRVPTPPRIIYK